MISDPKLTEPVIKAFSCLRLAQSDRWAASTAFAASDCPGLAADSNTSWTSSSSWRPFLFLNLHLNSTCSEFEQKNDCPACCCRCFWSNCFWLWLRSDCPWRGTCRLLHLLVIAVAQASSTDTKLRSAHSSSSSPLGSPRHARWSTDVAHCCLFQSDASSLLTSIHYLRLSSSNSYLIVASYYFEGSKLWCRAFDDW